MNRSILLAFLLLAANAAYSQPLCDFLFRDSIQVAIVGDTVTIWDFAACGYCSSTFVSSINVSGDSIYIMQTDTRRETTTCACLFDLATSIVGLTPRSYTVVINRDYRPPVKFIRSFTLNYTGRASATLASNSFQSSCIQTSVTGPLLEFPFEFALLQNYPNPFNPSTTFRYQTQSSGLVTIRVFDILGRHIRTLVDGFKPAGFYSVNFDPGPQAASGLYFCQMIAGRFTQTRTMLLVR
jgi:hypothetical protein